MNGLANAFKSAKCLFILDCCCASVSAVRSNVEILAAYPCNGEAEAYMFTHNICAVINSYEPGTSFSAAELMTNLKSKRSSWTDIKLDKEVNKYDLSGPVYVAARGSQAKPSFLFRVPEKSNHRRKDKGKGRSVHREGPSVLLELCLKDASKVPLKGEWREWIIKVPGDAEDIKITIQHVKETESALIYVVVPHVLWLLIEDHDAIRFRGMYIDVEGSFESTTWSSDTSVGLVERTKS